MADPLTIGLMVGGTILSAAGQVQQGYAAEAAAKAQAQALEYQKSQMEVNAGQERAMAQRRAIEESRQKRLAQSALQARSAAGGGGTLDGSVVEIFGDLEEEGQYNANVALYEGEERARDLESGATLKQYEADQERRAGKYARQSSFLQAGATLLSGASSASRANTELSMYDKYR